eukprot:Seg4227.1 transcript_id=Seg4227.1/GoldUCD/mRNA.D3Y31 product="Vacuolar protein sorting-associated protein 41" protein_id=Seg4227.1/GoldUCD/D3Y31
MEAHEMALQGEEKKNAFHDDDFEDDEEDEEPKLKYERIGNAVQEILQQDAASCMAVHHKFLALGTHWGVVHVLDHQGNNIRNKEFPSHTTTVNQISIDNHGEYVGSCSEDGRVVINGLYSSENNIQQMFDCPIRALALHPDYGKKGNRQYVIGVGEKMLLYEKSWLRNKNTVLYSGTGYIRTMKWKGNFLAWGDSQGVEVYDVNRRVRIAHIEKKSKNPRDDLYRCNLCWKDDRTLLIAWAEYIQIGVVKERESKDKQMAWQTGGELPPLCVELTNVFHTDFYACGIAPFGSELVVLSYFANQGEHGIPDRGQASRPQLLILSPQGLETYIESSTDALSIRGFEEYHSNNYFLENVQEESLFYIVSPKDIVLARPRDMDDHITWLMERDMFEEALADAVKHEHLLKTHNVLRIWKQYMNNLIEAKKYKEAASLCKKIIGDNKDLWEEEVYRFAKHRQLKAITPLIPYKKPRLSHTIYEMILNEYLQTDVVGFQNLIKEWPSDVYRSETIIYVLSSKSKEEPNNKILLQTLGTLYAQEKKYGKGLAIYLKLGDAGVFDMIDEHNLVEFVKDKILNLMEIDDNKAVKLLIDNIETINVEHVVRQLLLNKRLLHAYLSALFQKDPQAGQDFHEMQVELLAEFDKPKLLQFLKSSNYYALEKAFKVCEDRDYIPEMVFLLGRMGNSKKALTMIIEREQDIRKAIEFTKEQKDDVLWQDLINHSIDKPLFVKELLMNIGTSVDPIMLIGRIKPGMKIPGLRDALVKILQDYNLQVSLHEGCKQILDKDSVALMQRQLRAQGRGYSVQDDAKCEGCQGYIIVENSQQTANVLVFFCEHFYHERCLQQTGEEPFCPICSASVRKRKSTKQVR